MIKKIAIVVGAVFIFSISCVGCSSTASDATNDERVSEKRDSVKGRWVLTEIISRNEPVVGEELLQLYGGEFVYDFTDSKTVVVGVEPAIEECTYVQKGALVTVTFEGNGSVTTMTMIDNDVMEIDDPETHMIFERQ